MMDWIGFLSTTIISSACYWIGIWMGRRQRPAPLPPVAPDSRVRFVEVGFLVGYNVQAGSDRDAGVIAANTLSAVTGIPVGRVAVIVDRREYYVIDRARLIGAASESEEQPKEQQ